MVNFKNNPNSKKGSKIIMMYIPDDTTPQWKDKDTKLGVSY